jgi:hypothetical protein
MAIRPNIIRNIAEGLGDKLHNACRQNNVAHVELLTSKMTMDEQSGHTLFLPPPLRER